MFRCRSRVQGQTSCRPPPGSVASPVLLCCQIQYRGPSRLVPVLCGARWRCANSCVCGETCTRSWSFSRVDVLLLPPAGPGGSLLQPGGSQETVLLCLQETDRGQHSAALRRSDQLDQQSNQFQQHLMSFPVGGQMEEHVVL